ncbi:cation-translocating P-type ATPase [Oscillatoria sp. FACHB-1406]|uniref:cation-translocating P-type ATPase n=1 Tax=Oscillatoria sp. FACHB-1406 TaxID=2692846 RepID=UPI0016822A65|nr:cation-translocating P-type ATPase [Oscillatoria sp. FACHB-1406]MBD2579690.1 cation-translocating P-type ATPase [Oscillatoria sp. FACHB-1406]
MPVTAQLPSPKTSWYAQPLETTLQQLESNPNTGLSAAEASARSQRYGLNEITESGGRSAWRILLDQFNNIMLLMLIAVAVISGILDYIDLREGKAEGIPFKDTIAILAIVILNGLLGYLQESRAEKALAALKQMASPQVRVLRDGQPVEIEARELVPGDILLLEAGMQVAADGQLIEAANLQVRESALTGEAEAVTKRPDVQLGEDTPLGDRINMVFSGTEILQGRAKVVVADTGMNTELGNIAQMLQSVESEPTPLQQRMTQLGNVLVTGSLILVAIVVIIGVLEKGIDRILQPDGIARLRELLEVSLSMAVAVVPEGLPAVITVTLALGTQRMVRRNALIRKLPAVETLGSVNTICSDKTGTLTQNKMVVQEVETVGGRYRVTGEGYAPTGEFLNNDRPVRVSEIGELQGLLHSCVLCNDAVLQQNSGGNDSGNGWNILGDPTEGALLALAGKAGLEQKELDKQFARMGEFPFSSERKRMSVICGGSAQINPNAESAPYSLFSKGSPELVLERCQFVQSGENIEPLTEQQRQAILESNEGMAARGLRVLGFACKSLQAVPEAGTEEENEREMVWLGLVGMLDAPRPEVKLAVQRSREAGIRPVMITGDHQLTATAIASELGIAETGDRALSGKELERMSQEDLESEVDRVSIYARVSPEHKLRIVRALQKRGKFVAMTGDGVNDAPALKQADIGIAMGITGTDVSKEASDMVLLDDNFATIVAATEEGRVVYTNIRRFIKYILGSNVGEVITIAAAPLLGLGGVPLTPLQILWMNLVTDGLPALALAVEPPEPNVMRRPPFSPDENIFARGLGLYIVRIGIIFAIVSIALMVWAYNHVQGTDRPDSWKTMVFTSLCLAQMGHAIAARSHSQLAIEVNPFSNPFLLGAVAVTTLLQLMLVYVPPLQSFFGTVPLTQQELLICLGFSSLLFVWVELEKLFVRWYRSRK